jgi:replicative DNA helicase
MPAPVRLRGERDERIALSGRTVQWGVSFLDDVTRGIGAYDMPVVSAATGAGKTELASSIARHSAHAGRRTHLLAIEAAPKEIERRLKFALIAELAYRANDQRAGDLAFPDWIRGNCEEVASRYDAEAERIIGERYKTLHTFYRGANFDHVRLRETLLAIQNETELVILDHLHHVDVDDENENRGMKQIVTSLRDAAIVLGRPTVVFAHLRKRDMRSRQIMPSVEDIHGSSEISKVATHVILFAPAADIESPKWFLAPTFATVAKDRNAGATGLVALLYFDRRTRRYAPVYTLGRVVDGGTRWEELRMTDVPRWAVHHRALAASADSEVR